MISFQGVSFSYADSDSDGIHNITLDIEDGECVLFCGRSGCGKTTVIRHINGLIPHFYDGETSGHLLIDGQNPKDIPMYKIAQKVGSVFQNPRNQFFNVDADSEIAFGMENSALCPERLNSTVNETVSALGIESLRGRSMFSLSGGEKQKIAFASVYAMNPDIYVLDEPSSNLDATAIEILRKHLTTVKEQGKTIVIAEHRLYYLIELVDKIVYMDNGFIKNIYTKDQFLALSKWERERMGLRSPDLYHVSPSYFKDTNFSQEPVLEMQDLAAGYKKQYVFTGVNLRAARGEIIGVTGYNGAGKTTFSKVLCGLHRDYSGKIIWNGYEKKSKALLGNSYLVMQDTSYELFAESVEKECVFGIKYPDMILATNTLEQLGLIRYKEKHPNTLSDGQKQRLATAVSMVCGKDVLIYDEPTSGLDFDNMCQVADLFRSLSAQGKVVFIVTHDYELVCRACTRILYFNHHRLLHDFHIKNDNIEKLQGLLLSDLKNGGDK